MQAQRVWLLFIAGFVAIGSANLGAQIGGVVGGTGPGTYQGPMGGEDHPARVSSGVMAGLIVHKVQPEYPQDAKDAHVSGTVVMMAKIDKTGKVVDLKVVSGPEQLRDAALDAVWHWRYKPYLLNGQPVFVQTTVTVNFALQQ